MGGLEPPDPAPHKILVPAPRRANMAIAMPRAHLVSLGASLVAVTAVAILPLACAQGETGEGVGSGTTSAGSGHGASSSSHGAGGSGGASASSAGGSTSSQSAAGGSSASQSVAASSSGGPTSCDNNPMGCTGCTACANAGPCAGAWQACENSPGGTCVTFSYCLDQCDGDECCIDNCTTEYLDGSTAYYTYTACLCPACMGDCLGAEGC